MKGEQNTVHESDITREPARVQSAKRQLAVDALNACCRLERNADETFVNQPLSEGIVDDGRDAYGRSA